MVGDRTLLTVLAACGPGLSASALFAVVTSGRFAATAALGFPALAFGLSYLHSAKRWWLLLPAGLLGSLTLLVTFAGLFPHWDATPVLFLGFAATFTSALPAVAPAGG